MPRTHIFLRCGKCGDSILFAEFEPVPEDTQPGPPERIMGWLDEHIGCTASDGPDAYSVLGSLDRDFGGDDQP